MSARAKIDYGQLSDTELALRIADRDRAAVLLVTQRNNQRLFRTAWSIVKQREEAEDVVQATYLRGFAAIATFEGRSSLSTWLVRIAINEALGRMRAARRRQRRLDAGDVVDINQYRETLMQGSMQGSKPDEEVSRAQIRSMMEVAVGRLPAILRTTFILREVEGLSVDETSAVLGIQPTTVKTRCLRARRQLQQLLAPELKSALTGSFPFAGADCTALSSRTVAAWCDSEAERLGRIRIP